MGQSEKEKGEIVNVCKKNFCVLKLFLLLQDEERPKHKAGKVSLNFVNACKCFLF